MNLHPVFVHFPVALLTVYCLMELIRFRKITSQPYWFYAKALFVMVGGLGALAAAVTGDMAKHAVQSGNSPVGISNFRQVVSVHQNFAYLSIAIFGIIAASYLILWCDRENFISVMAQAKLESLWKFLAKFSHYIVETRFVILAALAGLICITLTGGLGGVMVYGPSADPFFGLVYRIMFP